MGSDSKFSRTVLVPLLCLWLAGACAAVMAADDDKKPQEAKGPIKRKAKSDEPILEIKRSGPPNCQVKPVMTDAEIEVCKRQRELEAGSKK